MSYEDSHQLLYNPGNYSRPNHRDTASIASSRSTLHAWVSTSRRAIGRFILVT
jgi:hypothetical protein